MAGIALLASAMRAPAAGAAPVSFSHDVQPILSESCAGCHRPGKMKGKLDLTSYRAFCAGGKTGPSLVPGDPAASLVVRQVTGPTPQMPDKGDPLTDAQVQRIAQWIREGAKDDTPSAIASDPNEGVPAEPPVYRLAPVVTALAFSPDRSSLAIAGEHEVLVRSADGRELIRRLPCRSPRITALLFAPDGRELIAVGGAPGQFGEIEVWNVSDWHSVSRLAISGDTLFGPSLSPDGARLAFGCADRTVRIVSLGDGIETQRLEPHADWALGAVFTPDGKRLASASRDKTVKLVDLDRPRESQDLVDATDPLLSIARSPSDDLLACGTAAGALRLYHLADVKKPTEANRDPNRVKELEHQPGPVNALAYSRDGALLAAGSVGEVRVYKKDGGRVASLGGLSGPVYAVSFAPDTHRLATAGFDGKVHLFELPSGKPIDAFVPVPLQP